MHQLLLLAALGSTAAHAAAVKPTGEAVVSGVVEVPLYAGPLGTDATSYVEAKVGEKTLFLRLATSHRELRLTEGAVGKLGLKTSGKEGKKTAKLDSMALGGATFEKLKVTVGSGYGTGIDGEIGLPGFEGLAYAVLPSAGKLRLATGPDGVGLVSAVGAVNPFETIAETVKKQIGTMKKEIYPVAVIVPVKWSDVEIRARLDIDRPATWLAREIEGVDWYTVKDAGNSPVQLPPAPGFAAAEWREEWRTVSFAGQTVSARVERRGVGPIWAFNVNAGLGADLLGAMDVAVDPVSGTFALKPAAVQKVDYAPIREAALRKALEPQPGEDGAAPDEAAKQAAREGGLRPLAEHLTRVGKFDEALTVRKELTILKPDDCSAWMGLGGTLAFAGKPAEAIEPLSKAAALYQPWAALPLDEREEISEAFATAEEKKEDWTGQHPQDHECHMAPGLLAFAHLQVKDPAAVASLYPAQLDLDVGLPIAAGTAALLKGDFVAAQAAYLQALKLGNGDGPEARVGLYLALAPRDFQAARGQLERLRLRFNGHTDPLLVRLYVEGVRKVEGAEGVKKALDTLLGEDPGDAVLLAQRGRERGAAGDAAGASADWTAAKARFQAHLAAYPNEAEALAAWASALAAAGESAEAQKAAETAVKLAPESGMAWLAMADAATAAGDAAKAAEARARAGMVWAMHPGYALLLAQ